MGEYRPNIFILCRVVKKGGGIIELIEIGEFPYNYNPTEMEKAIREELNNKNRVVVLQGNKDEQNYPF